MRLVSDIQDEVLDFVTEVTTISNEAKIEIIDQIIDEMESIKDSIEEGGFENND